MLRTELQLYLDELLACSRVKDYCPNGLQVEGKARIVRVVSGVTASLALIERAIALQADALLVHHGWFWRGEDGRVTGFRKTRMARLLAYDINLFAYHLPLDLHPELGNNAQLARLLGWPPSGRCGEQDLVFFADLPQVVSAAVLAEQVERTLLRKPCLFGDAMRSIRRVAWCTGAAQGYFEQALAAGADLYVSGEVSEQTVHLARESGVPYLAIGHHASERYGVWALGEHLAQRFGIEVLFEDVDNPV